MKRKFLALLSGVVLLGSSLATGSSAGDDALRLPEGFADEVVFTGLDAPLALAFSPDGRVFVAEKSGIIKVFDDLEDREPDIWADLRENVYNLNDRGLLGMTLDPEFPADPYVYVIYTFNGDIGGDAPKWFDPENPSEDVDVCPDPPGSHDHGCVVSGRLSRLSVAGQNVQEDVLVEGWCQQFSSHSIGDVGFLPDGTLLASGGDGATWLFADYGQKGIPKNPCGDPPTGIGGEQKPPTAEGGALRSQDLRTRSDPAGLSGSIIRVDPATGAGVAGNPLAGSDDANERRIVSYGLRNPFRFAVRPGTMEVYIADTGWLTWEEVNRFRVGQGRPMRNFGWPCYEGEKAQGAYRSLGLKICENLYDDENALTDPFFLYKHRAYITDNEPCAFRGGAGSGIQFYEGGGYPGRFDDALFFTDYTRGCMWWMPAGDQGAPDPSSVRLFGQVGPIVDLAAGPEGNLYYVDITGSVGRFTFGSGRAPVARLDATPRFGDLPLDVEFDASDSSDPNGTALTFEWDLDEDGEYDDGTGAQLQNTYEDPENQIARVRVTNTIGRRSFAEAEISPGNSRPSVVASSPVPTRPWRVGDEIELAADIDDDEEVLGDSAVHWTVSLRHCASQTECHLHHLMDLQGLTATFLAPEHEYPSDLRIDVEVTDSRGLTARDRLKLVPQATEIRVESDPDGLMLTAGGKTKRAPFSVKAIVRSSLVLTAPKKQDGWRFGSWSDGGARSHAVHVGSDPRSYKARYKRN